jgi:hypothetical protein
MLKVHNILILLFKLGQIYKEQSGVSVFKGSVPQKSVLDYALSRTGFKIKKF